MSRYTNYLKLIAPCVCIIITVEFASYIYFIFILDEEVRENALFMVYGETPSSSSRLIPKIKPYLWSNYQPYPSPPHANKLGWRYGGGEKSDNFRILCIGGSTTWSDKASSPLHSYPAQLEKYLNKLGYRIDVVNGGCPIIHLLNWLVQWLFEGYTLSRI